MSITTLKNQQHDECKKNDMYLPHYSFLNSTTALAFDASASTWRERGGARGERGGEREERGVEGAISTFQVGGRTSTVLVAAGSAAPIHLVVVTNDRIDSYLVLD